MWKIMTRSYVKRWPVCTIKASFNDKEVRWFYIRKVTQAVKVALVYCIFSEYFAEWLSQYLTTHSSSSPYTCTDLEPCNLSPDHCPSLLPHLLHFLLIPIHFSSRSLCKHILWSQWPPITHLDHLKSWNFIQGLYRLTPTQSANTHPRRYITYPLGVRTHCLRAKARTFIEKPIENRSNGLAMLSLHRHLCIFFLVHFMWFHSLLLFGVPQNLCGHPPPSLSQFFKNKL